MNLKIYLIRKWIIKFAFLLEILLFIKKMIQWKIFFIVEDLKLEAIKKIKLFKDSKIIQVPFLYLFFL